MKKAIKKLDKKVIEALTQVCEEAKTKFEGFTWLTHQANYQDFPASLMVTCVFDEDKDVERVLATTEFPTLVELVNVNLNQQGIKLQKPEKHIRLDSEQACQLHNNGDWRKRIS